MPSEQVVTLTRSELFDLMHAAFAKGCAGEKGADVTAMVDALPFAAPPEQCAMPSTEDFDPEAVKLIDDMNENFCEHSARILAAMTLQKRECARLKAALEDAELIAWGLANSYILQDNDGDCLGAKWTVRPGGGVWLRLGICRKAPPTFATRDGESARTALLAARAEARKEKS